MVELVDSVDLGSTVDSACGFESRWRHQVSENQMLLEREALKGTVPAQLPISGIDAEVQGAAAARA